MPIFDELRPLFNLKSQMLTHRLREFWQSGWLLPLSTFGIAVLFSGGGMSLFYWALKFFSSFPTVGPLIVDRVLVLFFTTLMVMLVFSGTLISFSTLYKAEESAYLWTLPLSAMSIFRARAGEAISLSSWAFLVLGGPMLLCWGVIQGAAALYYLALPLLLIPFALICGLMGSLLTVLFAYLFPRLNWKTLGAIIVIGALASGVYVLSAFAPWKVRGEGSMRMLYQVLSGLRNLQSPMMPGSWTFSGLFAAARGELGGTVWYLLLSWSSVLALDVILELLVPRLFFQGYSALSRESRPRGRSLDRGMIAWLGRRMGRMDPVARALVLRDFRLFWRDPSQWSQFLLFTLLMIVYVGNVRQLPVGIHAPDWLNIIHFTNLLACSLSLSTLISRFIYPLVSLEGKTFWVVGLAPLDRGMLLRQKLTLSLCTTLPFAETMMFASGTLLDLSRSELLLFCGLILLMNVTLSTMAIGLGAIFPDFNEDNPSKIVNGMGGLANFFLSLAYTLIVVLAVAVPFHLRVLGRLSSSAFEGALGLSLAGIFLLSALAALAPWILGRRRFRQVEF